MGFFNWIFLVPTIPTYRESVYRKHPLILTIDEISVYRLDPYTFKKLSINHCHGISYI